MEHFNSIQEFHKYMSWPPPEHPMFGLVSLASADIPHRGSSQPITTDFYIISLKYVISGKMAYGRTSIDFTRGSLLFYAPRQTIQWEDVALEKIGFVINIHEDYLRGHALGEKIKSYGFFSYTVNEALHLSPKEETIVTALYNNLAAEYNSHQDEHSKEIVLALLETLLKYAERFYKRQFIGRQELQRGLGQRFKEALAQYFATGKFNDLGTPSIDWIAKELAVSPRYLTDSLKAESGKTAIEHIHLYLIDEAKNLLLEPGTTVASVAYQLGFEYPQYFSRLFKKKVGVSPAEFRDHHMLQ